MFLFENACKEMFAKDRLLLKLQFYISPDDLLFPFAFGFSSGIIELDLSYLGDFLGIMCASLKHLHLLIDVRAVHPAGLVSTPCGFAHLRQQSLKNRPTLYHSSENGFLLKRDL